MPDSPHFSKKENSFKLLYQSTLYSIAGLRYTFKSERAFRLEIYLLIVLIPLSFWLSETPLECLLLLSSWVFVMIVELLNSAIETVIDRIGTEHHELSGHAKDIGSAAVMLSLLISLSVWITVILA